MGDGLTGVVAVVNALKAALITALAPSDRTLPCAVVLTPPVSAMSDICG